MFTKVLARYREEIEANLITKMFDPPSVDAIVALFELLSAPVDPEHVHNSGCLMVNTVSEFKDPPEDIEREITQYFEMWRVTFQQALENDNVPDAQARSEFLSGAFWGALTVIRHAGNTTAAEPMTSVIIQTVRSWTETD